MLNRTNRTLTATTLELNLGTRSLAPVAGVNHGAMNPNIRPIHDFDVIRAGRADCRFDHNAQWEHAAKRVSKRSVERSVSFPGSSSFLGGAWPLPFGTPNPGKLVVGSVPVGCVPPAGRPSPIPSARQTQPQSGYQRPTSPSSASRLMRMRLVGRSARAPRPSSATS